MTQDADTARHYRCPTCGATKELRHPIGPPSEPFPPDLPCGWRGCLDRAVPHNDGSPS